MTDPQKLLELLNGEFSSLTIGFNEDHAPNYCDAKTHAERTGHYSGGEDDIIEWASEEERLKAIENNSVWTIHWYPDTPVGFCCVGASTFERAAQFALETVKEGSE